MSLAVIPLKSTAAGTAMATSHGYFFFGTTGYPAEYVGTPNTGDTPHAHSPAAVQALDALALLALLLLALGCRLAEEVVGTLCVGGGAADAFFVDDVPHCSDYAAVGAWCWHDGLNVGGVDRCCVDATTGRLLAQTERGVGGDLGAAKNCFQREADCKLEAGSKEGEKVPHG